MTTIYETPEGAESKCKLGAIGPPQDSTWGFDQILDHIDIGILMLDLHKELIEYRNPVFHQVLQHDGLYNDFSSLKRLFLQEAELSQDGPLLDAVSGSVKLNDRLLGCSVYHIANRYCCIFIRDITERRRLETIAQAINSIDNLGFIFSGIRHEIGNPLNSLKMTLSVLKQNLGRFSEQSIGDYVDRSLADISRVEYLLKSLKSFSIFDAVSLVDVHFGNFMETFLALAERDLKKRGIHLKVGSPFDLSFVRIDPRAMNQVLLNIVANAADALTDQPNGEITITASSRDQIVWLTVGDNGCGISAKQKKHLFQPFNSSKPHGNGLGLVITQKLLTLMGSSIDIESRVDEGTRVTISLPTTTTKDNMTNLEEKHLTV